MDVLVVGSVNQDVTVRVERFPSPGETLLGLEVIYGLGGKGANQAVAAARAGAVAGLLATVGEDLPGRRLLDWLAERGVDTSLVATDSRPSGTAHIVVDAAGENQIVVVLGANAATSAARVGAADDAIAAASVVVVQGEIPWPASELALTVARAADTLSVVNLAPVAPISAAVLAGVDILVVNESEAAAMLSGTPPATVDEALSAVVTLASRCRSAVITLGARGAVWAETAGVPGHVAAQQVTAVDTTGAGDAFAGVLAASVAAGSPLPQAVRDGVAAATLTVQIAGAAMSYPAFGSRQ